MHLLLVEKSNWGPELPGPKPNNKRQLKWAHSSQNGTGALRLHQISPVLPHHQQGSPPGKPDNHKCPGEEFGEEFFPHWSEISHPYQKTHGWLVNTRNRDLPLQVAICGKSLSLHADLWFSSATGWHHSIQSASTRDSAQITGSVQDAFFCSYKLVLTLPFPETKGRWDSNRGHCVTTSS